ncbi:MAG: hypothetical protein V1887_04575 [Candidatus Aenigmatarchaeota archaeon]
MESSTKVDFRRLIYCLGNANAEQALIEDYSEGSRSKESGAVGIEVRKVLRQWAKDDFLKTEYNTLPNGRAEICYRPGKRWSQLLNSIQGTEKETDN